MSTQFVAPPVYPFRVPSVMYVGFGAAEKVPEEARRLGARRALLITDPGVARAGIAERVRALLADDEVATAVCEIGAGEPTLRSVEAAYTAVTGFGPDLLVGVGGGSAMDSTKGCSLLSANPRPIADYFGVERVPRRGLPMILVATTSGTASEVSPGAVFLDEKQSLKIGVVSQHLIADVAVVDPMLTLSVPPEVTAATGLDALTHALESYTAVKATPHTDLYGPAAIGLIGQHLRTAYARGSDLEARYHMALASFLAGFPMVNAGTGLCHAMSYPLGGTYRVPHGVANALLLPYVMEFNLPACVAKYAHLATALGEPVDGVSQRTAAQRAVDAVRRLSQDVGIPQRLRDVGVKEGDLRAFVPGTMSARRLIDNNPRLVTDADCLEVYQAAF